MAFRVHRFINSFPDQAIGAVIIILAAFVFNRFPLNFKFFLGNCIE